MTNVVAKLKKLARLVRAHFPSVLPRGKTEFEVWAADIVDLADAPKNPTILSVVATMVMHIPPTQSSKPKMYFIRSIHKAMTNQVADAIIKEVSIAYRAQQEKQLKDADEAKKQIESATNPTSSSR